MGTMASVAKSTIGSNMIRNIKKSVISGTYAVLKPGYKGSGKWN